MFDDGTQRKRVGTARARTGLEFIRSSLIYNPKNGPDLCRKVGRGRKTMKLSRSRKKDNAMIFKPEGTW